MTSTVYSLKTPRGVCFWNRAGIEYHFLSANRNILYVKYTFVYMFVTHCSVTVTQTLAINQLLRKKDLFWLTVSEVLVYSAGPVTFGPTVSSTP